MIAIRHMARVFFNRWRRDVARLALKTETFEEATQVGSGAAVAIEIEFALPDRTFLRAAARTG